MTAKLVTLLLTILTIALLSNCGSVPSTYYYRVDYQMPSPQRGEALPATLAIDRFDTDIIYEGERIVYRNSPYEVQYYHYRRWVAPPRKLVENAALDQFRNAGLFQRVIAAGAPESRDYVLKGRLKAFEEWDEAETWFGQVTVFFELLDSDNNTVVWQQEISHKKSAGSKEPVAVVASISESLKTVIQEAIETIDNELRK